MLRFLASSLLFVAVLSACQQRVEMSQQQLSSAADSRIAKPLPTSAAPDVKHMTVTDLQQALASNSDLIVLDVRETDELTSAPGHIIDSYHMPMLDVIADPTKLTQFKNKRIVTICYSGARSFDAARSLATAGYDVTTVDGGMKAWSLAGYPSSTEATTYRKLNETTNR